MKKKMNLANIQGKLSRSEMKSVMAGSGCYLGPSCTSVGATWCLYPGQSCFATGGSKCVLCPGTYNFCCSHG